MTLPGTLIIARHHESVWNKESKWTGTRDVHLTDYGFQKSEEMGGLLKGTRVDDAFASMQVRSIETLSCILNALELYHVPTEHVTALNERDYGDYTGKNKWEMKEMLGEEEFEAMRRNWEYPIPNGETLKMVYERVVPFYEERIVPLLAEGKNVLVVSHGNALRALMIYLESIPTDKAQEVKMLFGAVVLYQVDEKGKSVSKEIREAPSEVPA